MYEDYVFDDYLISPLDGSVRKGITSNHLQKFGHTFESFWKLYPDFPRLCNNAAKAVHSSRTRGQLTNKCKKQQREKEYFLCPSVCRLCKTPLHYKLKRRQFCSSSCAASFNNLSRKHSAETKQIISSKLKEITKDRTKKSIFSCVICNKNILSIPSRPRKVCSSECKNIHNSITVKSQRHIKRGGSTYKRYLYVTTDLKIVLFDSSWELLLAKSLDAANVEWNQGPTFVLSNGKRYTPDFFLVDYNCFIDPKAIRKDTYTSWYVPCVEKIRLFEKEFNTTCIIINNRSQLTWDYIHNYLTNMNYV